MNAKKKNPWGTDREARKRYTVPLEEPYVDMVKEVQNEYNLSSPSAAVRQIVQDWLDENGKNKKKENE